MWTKVSFWDFVSKDSRSLLLPPPSPSGTNRSCRKKTIRLLRTWRRDWQWRIWLCLLWDLKSNRRHSESAGEALNWPGTGYDTCSSAWSCNCYLGMLSVTVLHTLQVAVKIIPKSKVFSWSKVSRQWRPVVPTLTLKCWPC